MSIRSVTFQGNPLTLVGSEAVAHTPAPTFTVLDNNLAPVTQAILPGKVTVLVTVPSLDTPVCDMETRRFNAEAAGLGEDVHILCISADLPFAQVRWCGAAGIDKVQTLSDHYETSFGQAYGVLIKELRLLARAVFVVDRDAMLKYIQIVPEITNEPDYAAVVAAVKELV
jgi:thiol peroxidase